MKFKLPSGEVAQIDEADGHLLTEYRWHKVSGYVQMGLFITKERAAKAYEQAAKKLHGEFLCV